LSSNIVFICEMKKDQKKILSLDSLSSNIVFTIRKFCLLESSKTDFFESI